MNPEEHKYIVHTIKDNTKNTKKEVEKLSEYLNDDHYEIMITFSNGSSETYFLLTRHDHEILDEELSEEIENDGKN